MKDDDVIARWLEYLDYNNPSEEDLKLIDLICEEQLLNVDCSYCLTAEVNAFQICGWCPATADCVNILRSQPDCPTAVLSGAAGLMKCPTDPMQWGHYSCGASQNQNCAVCLNDAACSWCEPSREAQLRGEVGRCVHLGSTDVYCNDPILSEPFACPIYKPPVELADKGALATPGRILLYAVVVPFALVTLLLVFARTIAWFTSRYRLRHQPSST